MAKKKKNKGLKKVKGFIAFILFVCVIAFVGFFGFKGYQEVNNIYEIIESFEYEYSIDYNEKINLPKEINEQIKIEWKSSNEKVISNSGEIFELGFEEDDTVVTLTGTVVVTYKEFLSPTIQSFLGIEYKQFIEEITIEANEATDEDKVLFVLNKLELVDEIYSSISLPTCLCYESIIIK